MKSIVLSRKVTPKRTRTIELERGPFFGLIVGYETHSYKNHKERDLTILFLCFSIRYQVKIHKEVSNEYSRQL
tara:strand:- start:3843 stop:4061 length:219 start_codon:yes stop_codon:yes gene_type:complete